MEYLIISIFALILSLLLSLKIARLNPRYLLMVSAISIFFQLIFDNYFTYLGLWIFDYSHTLRLLLPIIPLENLIFGISLTLMSIASWELLQKKKS